MTTLAGDTGVDRYPRSNEVQYFSYVEPRFESESMTVRRCAVKAPTVSKHAILSLRLCGVHTERLEMKRRLQLKMVNGRSAEFINKSVFKPSMRLDFSSNLNTEEALDNYTWT